MALEMNREMNVHCTHTMDSNQLKLNAFLKIFSSRLASNWNALACALCSVRCRTILKYTYEFDMSKGIKMQVRKVFIYFGRWLKNEMTIAHNDTRWVAKVKESNNIIVIMSYFEHIIWKCLAQYWLVYWAFFVWKI